MVLIAAALVLLSSLTGAPATPQGAAPATPQPRAIRLSTAGDYQPLLDGPPGSVSMRSGHVVLAPGKSVGKHSTEANEEMLVVLEGRGELRLTGGPVIPIEAGTVTYCPPQIEHDVTNTGASRLRYVYVVAPAIPGTGTKASAP